MINLNKKKTFLGLLFFTWSIEKFAVVALEINPNNFLSSAVNDCVGSAFSASSHNILRGVKVVFNKHVICPDFARIIKNCYAVMFKHAHKNIRHAG